MFKNREKAGELLAEEIEKRIENKKNTVILAIPRGGVLVAYKISEKTGIPFGMIISKKIALPYDPEAAIGAATSDGTYLLADFVSEESPEVKKAIQKAIAEANEKLNKYLQGKEPDIKDKTVIIVDDGIATGFTAMVAGKYAKNIGAKKVILAIPVCPTDSIQRVRKIFDDVICFHKVDTPFFAVGAYYQDFHQVSDWELMDYLKKAEKKGLLYK